MPRTPGAVNNEFVATESDSRSPMVCCRHCSSARVAKSSAKRKIAHLRKCVSYRRFLGSNPMPSFEGDDGDEEAHLGSPRLNSTNSSKGFVDAMPHRWPLTGPIKADSTALIVLDMQRDFCEQGGLLAQSGHPIAAARSIIPPILRLLHASRVVGLPVYHVRHSHRHDLSTFSANERARQTSLLELPPMPRMESSCDPHSRPLPPRKILPLPGTQGPLGHFLLRQSPGTDPVVELCPLYHEVLIDHSKPSAFAYTDLDLLLRNRDIRNLIIVGLDVNDSLVATVRDAAEKRYDCLLVQGCIASVSSIVPLSSGQHLEQGVTVDLSLFEQAASAVLAAVIPSDWTTTSGFGTISTYAALQEALGDLSTIVSPTANQHQSYKSPYMSQPTLAPKPPTSQLAPRVPGMSPVSTPIQAAPPAVITAAITSSNPTAVVPTSSLPPITSTTAPLSTISPRKRQMSPMQAPLIIKAHSVPGGRTGAGGRRGRGINNPIFYTPPTGGIPHPRRPARTAANKLAASFKVAAENASMTNGGTTGWRDTTDSKDGIRGVEQPSVEQGPGHPEDFSRLVNGMKAAVNEHWHTTEGSEKKDEKLPLAGVQIEAPAGHDAVMAHAADETSRNNDDHDNDHEEHNDDDQDGGAMDED